MSGSRRPRETSPPFGWNRPRSSRSSCSRSTRSSRSRIKRRSAGASRPPRTTCDRTAASSSRRGYRRTCPRAQSLRPRKLSPGFIGLVVGDHDPSTQTLSTTQIVLGGDLGVRVFPVVHRYAWPSELDLMARLAGLALESRWADWSGAVRADEHQPRFRVSPLAGMIRNDRSFRPLFDRHGERYCRESVWERRLVQVWLRSRPGLRRRLFLWMIWKEDDERYGSVVPPTAPDRARW